MRIKNTKHLMEVDISEAYKKERRRRKDLTVIEKARPFSFDTDGNLKPF